MIHAPCVYLSWGDCRDSGPLEGLDDKRLRDVMDGDGGDARISDATGGAGYVCGKDSSPGGWSNNCLCSVQTPTR